VDVDDGERVDVMCGRLRDAADRGADNDRHFHWLVACMPTYCRARQIEHISNYMTNKSLE